MANFYITLLPDKSAVYGRLKGVCGLAFHKYLGIRTPDVNADPVYQALQEIRKLDDSPDIKFYFNDVPPDKIYDGGL